MTASRRATGVRDERGAFLVVWAILLVAMFAMVAIVIDLGQLRNTRRDNQSIADFAALAAVQSLQSSTPERACLEAWTYIRSNTSDLPTGASMPCSSRMPNRCNPGTNVATATGSGPYTVSVQYPVDDSQIQDASFSSSGSGSNDGDRCERMRVTVSRTRETLFAGVIGFDSLNTTSSAVARVETEKTKDIPSLWLLDPKGCVSLGVSGAGTSIRVGLNTTDLPVMTSSGTLTPPIAGFVTVDSDGQTCGPRKTLDSGGGATVSAVPSSGLTKGAIKLFALPTGQSCTSSNPACDPADLSGALTPTPERLDTRATRSPVDWVYNCKATYPAFHGLTFPTEIQPCAQADPARSDYKPPYIDDLRAALQTGVPPAGFQRWTAAGHSCSPGASIPPALTAGNWWVDCPTFRLTGSTAVTFTGGNVVFDGAITLSGGALSFNTLGGGSTLTPACYKTVTSTCLTAYGTDAAFVYQRAGDLSMTGGVLNVSRTMLYQHNGALKITGGSPPKWSSPTAGPFKGLALWSEKSDTYTLNGGAALDLEGVYFTPEAKPFKLTGGGSFQPLAAQFISYQLEVSGGGTLKLVPNADQQVSPPKRAGTLIR